MSLTAQHEFYFPKINVFVTSIPKNGCTSLRGFFRALETGAHLGSGDRAEHVSNALREMSSRTVHVEKSVLDKLRNPSVVPDDATRILILRSPIDRFMSLFTNLIVLLDNGGLAGGEFYFQEWFAKPMDDIVTVRNKASQLLDWLSQDDNLMTD